MAPSCSTNHHQLIVLASSLAALLAQHKTPEEISRLAAFFTLLGDTLALLALQPDCNSSDHPCTPNSSWQSEAYPSEPEK